MPSLAAWFKSQDSNHWAANTVDITIRKIATQFTSLYFDHFNQIIIDNQMLF